MGLKEYRRKRDFHRTAEPRGKLGRRRKALIFVVQKHAASHLHYDFRLEWDGVLLSWAVPKGPDLDPAQKRLAMRVEDHPIDYADFEGIIPAGEYGGGTVMIWDQGTWEPVGDARLGLSEGHLKFVIHGEKLRGGWMLVRRGGKSGPTDERTWFLFKERDQFAGGKTSITAAKPLSVVTGRDLDQIAADEDRVWSAEGEVKTKTKKKPAAASVRLRRQKPRAANNPRTTAGGPEARRAAAR